METVPTPSPPLGLFLLRVGFTHANSKAQGVPGPTFIAAEPLLVGRPSAELCVGSNRSTRFSALSVAHRHFRSAPTAKGHEHLELDTIRFEVVRPRMAEQVRPRAARMPASFAAELMTPATVL